MDTWEDKQEKKRHGKGGNRDVGFVTKLGAAKHALALAQEMPDFTDLIEHAEAVRAAAKALHISAEGINAWTRFVVDAERKAWAHIEAMRDAGAMVTSSGGGAPRQKTGVLALKDVIDRRPGDRAKEWSQLSKLTEHQLNEMEKIANEEDRLLTRGELLSLVKAGTPTSSRGEKQRSNEDLGYISLAIEGYASNTIEIREDAKIDKMERGAWVGAWVWVDDPLAQSDLEE
jgi:hypothetical protein